MPIPDNAPFTNLNKYVLGALLQLHKRTADNFRWTENCLSVVGSH